MLLLFTGTLAGVVATLHLTLGGREVARPLLAAEALDPVVRYTSYYCWHLVTIVLYAMAAGFGAAAILPGGSLLVGFLTISACAFSLWGFVLVAVHSRSFAELPQGLLFLPVAVLGLWATFA